MQTTELQRETVSGRTEPASIRVHARQANGSHVIESVKSQIAGLPSRAAHVLWSGMAAAVDRTIGLVSPEREYQRTMYRKATMQMRGYEAATKDRNNAHRKISLKDADSELNGKQGRIRSIAREECRNNGFARNAKKSRRNNVVGDADAGQGITIDPAVVAADGTPDEEVNKELKGLWKRYRDKLDLRGFWGLQDILGIADQEMFEAGEVLAILHDEPAPGSEIPFSIELLEADRLPMSHETIGVGTFGRVPVINRDGTATENWVRHGIEYNTKGQRVAYHILQDHPGNEYMFSSILNTKRVAADNVVHYFDPDRAEQTRGVSSLIAALPLLADIRDLGMWELIANKYAACMGIVFTGGNLANLPFPQNQTTNPPQDTRGNTVTEIQPGMALQSAPGSDVKMFQGNRPGGTFLPYFQSLVRWVSAAVGMGYSTIAKDYSGGSFSSLRQEALEDRRAYRTSQGQHSRHFCRRIWQRFVRASVLAGQTKTISNKAFMDNPERFTACDIQTPGWDYVNPLQEATAEAVQLANGMKCLDEVPNVSGMEPEERLVRLAAEKKLAESLGLELGWTVGVPKPSMNNAAIKAEMKDQKAGAVDDE